ncbi:C4-dicarboxylate ABC transporter substrate-binding protein [Candidatus Atribacteria bacterium HGW-Atribacteria-1]|nr:MAG: C4-dicarboxylate ABC transporter substrate-binding protein [Candidatus Atribacteria bacterium HGW-Atribacteria-1]
MNFKKREILLVILALILTLSCMNISAEVKRFTLATGGVAGTYYPIGGAIANIITKFVPGVELTAESTGASVANLKMAGQGEVDFLMGASNTTFAAFSGEEPFDKAVKNIRGITALYPETFQFIVRKDSGIKSFSDLKGKRVVVGAPGSGTERTANLVLNMYGITYDDLTPEFLSFAEGVTALKDRTVDCAIVGAGVPTAAVIDAAASMDIFLIPIDKEIYEKYSKDYPFLGSNIIPAGLYKGVDEDIFTVASPALLSVREDISEEVVYEVTKAIFEHLDILAETHAQGKNIKLENALNGMSIPLHPGAERYYKEKGILK